MNFRVLEEAYTDADSIMHWLEDTSPSGGFDFRDLFFAALKAIQAHPRQYSLTEDGFNSIETRECYIERFKQRVIYAITDSEVVILAVIHAHCRPGIWTFRIDQI